MYMQFDWSVCIGRVKREIFANRKESPSPPGLRNDVTKRVHKSRSKSRIEQNGVSERHPRIIKARSQTLPRKITPTNIGQRKKKKGTPSSRHQKNLSESQLQLPSESEATNNDLQTSTVSKDKLENKTSTTHQVKRKTRTTALANKYKRLGKRDLSGNSNTAESKELALSGNRSQTLKNKTKKASVKTRGKVILCNMQSYKLATMHAHPCMTTHVIIHMYTNA